jgi:hypothetical protein
MEIFIISVMAQQKSVHNRKSYFIKVQFHLIFPYTPWYVTCLLSSKFFNQKFLRTSFEHLISI